MKRDFIKYMHVEKYGKDEVQGIELGKCFVFSKLDGTSGVIWNSEDVLQAGSRNRHLSLDNDNANFLKTIEADDRYVRLIKDFPDLYFYGEWLKRHTIKHYEDSAWSKFYIFDVYDSAANKWLPYSQYKAICDKYQVEYVPAITWIESVTYNGLLFALDNDTFCLKKGTQGEGIVIKNYDFVNKFGEVIWAKIVRDSFQVRVQVGKPVEVNPEAVEQYIVDDYVGKPLIDKEYAKIVNEQQGWNSKLIPRLLNTIYHCLITEELWDILKKHKNPVINFKTLQRLCTTRVKMLRTELF